MSKKIEYKYVYEQFKKNGLALIDKTYINSETRMECEDKEGYKYCYSYSKIKEGNIKLAHKFSTKNKFALYNIQKYIKENSINNTVLLSTSAVRDGEKLLFKCGLCSKDYYQEFKNFQISPHKCCPRCERNFANIEESHDIKYVINCFNESKYKLLNTNYKNIKQLLDVEDEDGYRGLINLNYLRKGFGFKKFFYKNPYSIYNLKWYIKLNNLNIEVLSNNYIKRNENIKFKCECGEIFERTVDSFVGGSHRCLKCSNKKSNLEVKVEKWLKENNIKYIFQYKHKDCKNKRCLPFDFYIENFGLIEVDGKQHYDIVGFTGKTKEERESAFQKIQIRDNIKNKFCKDNNIKLLRIKEEDFYNNKYIEILNNELKH